MSNAFLRSQSGSGPVPPEVATSYTTDFQADQTTPNGTSIPAANNLEIRGESGISTFSDPDNGKFVYIKIKNSETDIGVTLNAQTITLSTFDCSAAGTYKFTSEISAYTAAGPAASGQAGAGSTLYTTVISNGASATVIDDSDPIAHVSTSIMGIDYEIVTIGTSANLEVTGVNGCTIDWGAFSVFVYRG